MPRLAEITEGLGHRNVWTYINSGNVVFDGSGSRATLERSFEKAFEDDFGFETTTFVRSAPELRKALALAPFRVATGDTYFVTFLKEAPSTAARRALEALSNRFDTLAVAGRDVHWRMRGKSTDTTLPAKAWAAIVGDLRSTSRNTNMLRKLVEKIDAGSHR